MVAANKAVADTNAANKIDNKPKEEANAITENEYNNILAIVNNTNKGDYVNMRELIRKNPVLNTSKGFEDSYRQFYVNEKIDKWDPTKNVTRKPPYGDFDYAYYAEENP